ncbi:MAG: hypothetical protein ACJ71Q_08995 [Terriglobales bacterium]
MTFLNFLHYFANFTFATILVIVEVSGIIFLATLMWKHILRMMR